MNFTSQIATTREQSRKLLVLGLKPETADMYWCEDSLFVTDWSQTKLFQDYPPEDKTDEFYPGWSLSRLLELLPKLIEHENRPNANLDISSDGQYWFVSYEELGYDLKHQEMKQDLFDAVISTIEWLVSEGKFNKEYTINNQQ